MIKPGSVKYLAVAVTVLLVFFVYIGYRIYSNSGSGSLLDRGNDSGLALPPGAENSDDLTAANTEPPTLASGSENSLTPPAFTATAQAGSSGDGRDSETLVNSEVPLSLPGETAESDIFGDSSASASLTPPGLPQESASGSGQGLTDALPQTDPEGFIISDDASSSNRQNMNVVETPVISGQTTYTNNSAAASSPADSALEDDTGADELLPPPPPGSSSRQDNNFSTGNSDWIRSDSGISQTQNVEIQKTTGKSASGNLTAGKEAAAGQRVYVVRAGDSLSRIAARELGSIRFADAIFLLNTDILASPNELQIGMALKLPPKEQAEANKQIAAVSAVAAPKATQEAPEGWQKHTVLAGDSLFSIANKYYGAGKNWNLIFQANKATLPSPSGLRVGDILLIPPARE